MPQLSAIIITKDEAANISACLDSLAFCDERIVVDAASSDGTLMIAKQKGARVATHGWKGFGPVPWSHEPNRGFLRCVTELAKAAEAIGEYDEQERCTQLLRDCDPNLAP